MRPQQEQRLHVHERMRVGGQPLALSDTWRATGRRTAPQGLGTGGAQ